MLSEIRWMEKNISLAPTGSLSSCHVSNMHWAQSESPLSKPDPFQMWAAELERVTGNPLPVRASCTSQRNRRGIFQSHHMGKCEEERGSSYGLNIKTWEINNLPLLLSTQFAGSVSQAKSQHAGIGRREAETVCVLLHFVAGHWSCTLTASLSSAASNPNLNSRWECPPILWGSGSN